MANIAQCRPESPNVAKYLVHIFAKKIIRSSYVPVCRKQSRRGGGPAQAYEIITGIWRQSILLLVPMNPSLQETKASALW